MTSIDYAELQKTHEAEKFNARFIRRLIARRIDRNWLAGTKEPTLYLTLLVLGITLLFVGSLGIVIQAFRIRFGWGIACGLFPPFQWLFVANHWNKTYHVFLCQAFGLALMFIFGPQYERTLTDSEPTLQLTLPTVYIAANDDAGLPITKNELLGTWKVVFAHDMEPMEHLLEYTFHSDGTLTFYTQYDQDESGFDTFTLPYSFDGKRLEILILKQAQKCSEGESTGSGLSAGCSDAVVAGLSTEPLVRPLGLRSHGAAMPCHAGRRPSVHRGCGVRRPSHNM